VTENRVIREHTHALSAIPAHNLEELKNRLFAVLYPMDEAFENISDRGVEELRETNTYWDKRIMVRKNGSLFWCRVRGHSFTRDARSLKRCRPVEIRPYHPLTRREREIVSPLGEGKTSKGTALKLDFSYRAVEVYRAKLRKKFGAVDANGLFQALSGVSKGRLVNSGQGTTV